MEAQELRIEWEDTDSLVTYCNNAKIHTGEQVDQIKRSIEEFGFNDPIAVWTNQDGKSEIVEGHGRLLAAQELGIGKLPVIHLDRLTDEQRRAYTHVHNQLTMNTGFDLEILQGEITALDGFDFGGYGFDFGGNDDECEPYQEEEAEEEEEEEEGEPAEQFDVLFVYHGEEEERKLSAFLCVEMPLRSIYAATEVNALWS